MDVRGRWGCDGEEVEVAGGVFDNVYDTLAVLEDGHVPYIACSTES